MLHYFISRINWLNKTKSRKEIIKTKCDSVKHTCFPKEDHLPNWARRDNEVMKGGHLEKKHEKLTLAYFSLQANICLSQRTYIYHYVIKCIGDHRYRLFLSNNKKNSSNNNNNNRNINIKFITKICSRNFSELIHYLTSLKGLRLAPVLNQINLTYIP